MRKFLLVYNPVSGNASFKQRLDEMIWRFQKLGCMLILYRTSKALGDLALYVRARRGYSLRVATARCMRSSM